MLAAKMFESIERKLILMESSRLLARWQR